MNDLGTKAIEAIVSLADGKLDVADVVKLGELLGAIDVEAIGEALRKLFTERIGSIDKIGARLVD